MVHGENRISYRIDRRLSGLAGPDYHAIISFGLPFEPEDSQYGEYRPIWGIPVRTVAREEGVCPVDITEVVAGN